MHHQHLNLFLNLCMKIHIEEAEVAGQEVVVQEDQRSVLHSAQQLGVASLADS